MTDTPTPPENATAPADVKSPETARIAKVMARAGVASRRDAERMILDGRVAVNGRKIDSPALDVGPKDRVTVDGKPIDAPQETRLWLYYKPVGLVTSERDEKGRQTVFDALPSDLPRVMSVGRLDLNSEGLLLLTNDGALKRRLELPATGWLRRYRVRVNGQPNDLTFDPLRKGITIDGEEFQPMEVRLDSQRGTNAWLTVGIREGRNREIRRAMAEVGLMVSRLIRIGYGPFRLDGLEEGELKEVRRRILKDQLGGLLTGDAEDDARPKRFARSAPARGRGRDDDRPKSGYAEGRPRFGTEGETASGPRKPRHGKSPRPFPREGEASEPRRDGRDGPRSYGMKSHSKPFGGGRGKAEGGQGETRPNTSTERRTKPSFRRDGEERRPYAPSEGGPRAPYAKGERGDDRARVASKPYTNRQDGARKPYGSKPYNKREDGDAPRFANRQDEGRKPYARREDGDGPRKPYGKPYQKRENGPRGGYDKGEGAGRVSAAGGDRKPFAKRDNPDRGPVGKNAGKGFGNKRPNDKPRFDKGPRDRGGFKPRQG